MKNKILTIFLIISVFTFILSMLFVDMISDLPLIICAGSLAAIITFLVLDWDYLVRKYDS